MENSVFISLEDYDRICSENAALTSQNDELELAIADLQESDGQRVIVRETETTIFSDGSERVEKTTRVKGFADVRDEVETFFKAKIEEMETTIEELRDKLLDVQVENSRLRNRSLWQRIRNK